MRLLLDTHILLWAAAASPRLSSNARDLIADPENEVVFSIASIWEVAIKAARGREDFAFSAAALRAGLRAQDYFELSISGDHVLQTLQLPVIHKDPFDRLLVAQAMSEGLTLLTSDRVVASYSQAIMQV